ncbi:hypothetical protein [Colwellia sp. Arc7-D]|uniref:hypothetical protein n=1 Tax=Colwellia sp. Arc7-D TaxID=2161872 RepID=UPI000D3A367F|nr:hypothetical protein [Colwellia sp. Arc7-D]AWB57848.1 hypothetical protein DBO93_09875 [Colwellia sp. Arc7-D]
MTSIELKPGYPLLFAIVIIVVMIVAALSLFNKRSDVLITLQVETLSFETRNDLNNLFALSRTIDKNDVYVQNFSVFEARKSSIGGESAADNKISTDIGDRLSLRNVSVNELNIPEGAIIKLSSFESEVEQVSIQFQNIESSFDFHPINNDSSYRFNTFKEKKIPEGGAIIVKPSDEKFNMSFRFEDASGLMESEIIKIDHLNINQLINETLQPSIKSGIIEVLSIGEKINIHKNSRLYFQASDIFYITDLFIKNGSINVVLEGHTSSIEYGSNRTNIIPNYLYFFAKNNFILIIFNTIFVLITFTLTLVKFTNEK